MFKYDIFISYSRKDLDTVQAIKEEIEANVPGITCWFDMDGIESGEEFVSKIATAIDQSHYLLFFLSKNSMTGKWTQKEVLYASSKNKRIIPIRIGTSALTPTFDFLFADIDQISWNEKSQRQKLFRNLIYGFPEKAKKEEKPRKSWKAALLTGSALVIAAVAMVLVFNMPITPVSDSETSDSTPINVKPDPSISAPQTQETQGIDETATEHEVITDNMQEVSTKTSANPSKEVEVIDYNEYRKGRFEKAKRTNDIETLTTLAKSGLQPACDYLATYYINATPSKANHDAAYRWAMESSADVKSMVFDKLLDFGYLSPIDNKPISAQ